MIEAVHRSIRVYYIVLVGYEVPKDFRAANAVSGLKTA